jgi:hypothetical protein
MPTVLLIKGIRFFFYSNESQEPMHIHVSKGDADGKIWLVPELSVCYFEGFSNAEEKDIMQITEAHYEQFKAKWNEYFNQ